MSLKAAAERELYERLTQALEKYKGKRGVLIAALQEAQQIFGYLPRKVMIHVANELTIPLSEVYSVVSFYSLFSTMPTGRIRLEVCMGTACYVKGAEELLKGLKEELGVEPGEVTKDGLFSIATTRCVGACSAAPVLKVGEELHGKMTRDRISPLLEELKQR
ncbi:MAG: NAD(P)H-dependent oxidoreductase subunit E [Firmicutes bacterium]|nr:NAD(P)H-dependent oxidoreductase subunit E [Bacillota bacterium]